MSKKIKLIRTLSGQILEFSQILGVKVNLFDDNYTYQSYWPKKYLNGFDEKEMFVLKEYSGGKYKIEKLNKNFS